MTIKVYDRVYLDVPGKTLVIELLDGYEGPTGTGDYIDAWRLIDLKTGEVFAQETNLYDVIGVASLMTSAPSSSAVQVRAEYRYIEGRPPTSTYRLFKDLPLADRMRYVTELAQDLEHDFRVLEDVRDPIATATKDLNDMYNEKPCFYLDRKTGKWELDTNLDLIIQL